MVAVCKRLGGLRVQPPSNKILFNKLNNRLDCFKIVGASVAFVAGCEGGSKDSKTGQEDELL